MRVIRVTTAAVLTGLVAVTLTACGSATTDGGSGASSSSSSAPAPPDAVPPATGPVTGLGTVIEVPETGPQLCLGPVRESFPPQCEGVPLSGWSWAKAGIQEESPAGTGTKVRWGTYAVTGTFDGLTMTLTSSIPLALYDAVAQPSPRPMAPPELTDEEWAGVESGVRVLPGMLSSLREGDTGPVLVDVVHDDGTLQDWADAAFGVGAVRVTSMLR